MRRTFLRSPEGPMELAADALRIVGTLSIVAAWIGWSPVTAGAVALSAAGTLLPRALGIRPGVDLAFGVVVLVAAWSSVLDLYGSIRWIDIPIHLALNGLLAAFAYALFVRLGAVPDAAHAGRPRTASVVLTAALGLSLAVLWEVAEWAGHTFVDEAILVGYDDSIGDLVVGGLGSLIAGLMLPVLLRDVRNGDRETALATA